MVKTWMVPPGKKAHLAKIDPASTPKAPGERDAVEEKTAELTAALTPLHDRLWAERTRSVLLVLQAMDTGGKDGTISHVLRGLNPQGVRVRSFKAPTDLELAHDFLWRVHQATPERGELGVFNRSHYEDVLVARVHELVPEDVWRARYDQINAFEGMLVGEGTTVVKCYLHISRDEQAKRLRARIDDPDKRWKFKKGDLAERERWDDYQAAYEDALTATSTAAAPWHVIPADKKWYRNYAVSRILLDVLTALDPRFPPPEADVDGVRIT